MLLPSRSIANFVLTTLIAHPMLVACSGGPDRSTAGAAVGGESSVGGSVATETTTSRNGSTRGGTAGQDERTGAGGTARDDGSPTSSGTTKVAATSESAGGRTSSRSTTNAGGSVAPERTSVIGGRSGAGGTTAERTSATTKDTRATGGRTGTGASAPTGGSTQSGSTTVVEEAPTCSLPDPSAFQPKLSVGGGGTPYKESDHFIVFGSTSVDATLNLLEAAHQCFVEEWCWRSPGLSITSNSGTYYKFNVYQLSQLDGGAAGLAPYDYSAGLSYVQVLPNYSTDPGVTVHEFGHALTLTEKNWVEQGRTGLWWEAVANFVADTFMTSPYCANARTKHGITTSRSVLEPDTVISKSYMILCVNGNQYDAWPFLAYLTNNPDNYPGLGRMAVPNLFRTYKIDSNETPLHTLERLAAPTTVQAIVGRYWARMAYVDIGNPKAQKVFLDSRSRLNFSNLTSSGAQTYKVISERQPRYFGSNIIPLKIAGDGSVSVQITNLGNGRTESNFTATLSIRKTSEGTVRYVELPNGSGQATILDGEEASLVVVNTPDTLYLYDPSSVGANDPANTGLNYSVQITGATPAN